MPGLSGWDATQHIRAEEMDEQVRQVKRAAMGNAPNACSTWPVVIMALTAQALEGDRAHTTQVDLHLRSESVPRPVPCPNR